MFSKNLIKNLTFVEVEDYYMVKKKSDICDNSNKNQ